MALIAKPVVDKQFWILQENNQKVGNIEACAGGYQVKINGHIEEDFGFNTHKEAFENAKETFERLLKRPHANY